MGLEVVATPLGKLVWPDVLSCTSIPEWRGFLSEVLESKAQGTFPAEPVASAIEVVQRWSGSRLSAKDARKEMTPPRGHEPKVK